MGVNEGKLLDNQVECAAGCGKVLERSKDLQRDEHDECFICDECWAERPTLRQQIEGEW